MSRREHYWAWLHPKADEGDTFAMPGGGSAAIMRKEETVEGGRIYVRFLVAQKGEKLLLPWWTTPVPKDVPPHLRSTS